MQTYKKSQRTKFTHGGHRRAARRRPEASQPPTPPFPPLPPPHGPLPVVGSLAPSPKPSVSLLLLREQKRRYRAKRRARDSRGSRGSHAALPAPIPAHSLKFSTAPAFTSSVLRRDRESASDAAGPQQPSPPPGPARYPQSSRSPSMAAVLAPEAEEAALCPRSRRMRGPGAHLLPPAPKRPR